MSIHVVHCDPGSGEIYTNRIMSGSLAHLEAEMGMNRFRPEASNATEHASIAPMAEASVATAGIAQRFRNAYRALKGEI